MTLPLFFYLLLLGNAYAGEQLAEVLFVRGDVQVDKKAIGKGEWVSEGMVISTGEKSLAKIMFRDKTQITVGPGSSLEINHLKKNEPPMMTLLNGAIRSKVQKELSPKNKLLIMTATAAMGVRGTEIHVSFNPKNKLTNVITYDGELKMVQKDPAQDVNDSNINQIIDSDASVTISEGRFSSANPSLGKMATLPVKLNPAQFFALKNNKDFNAAKRTVRKGQTFRSIVLPGLRPSNIFVNQSAQKRILSTYNSKIQHENVEQYIDSVWLVQSSIDDSEHDPPPEGLHDTETGRLAPPAGGLIDQNTGIYLAPPQGSLYDENTGVYTLSSDYGTFDPETGEYVSPQGYELNHNGEFIANAEGSAKTEHAPPSLASSQTWGSAAYLDGIVTDDASVTESSSISNDEVLLLSRDILLDFNNRFYDHGIEQRTKVNMGFSF